MPDRNDTIRSKWLHGGGVTYCVRSVLIPHSLVVDIVPMCVRV